MAKAKVFCGFTSSPRHDILSRSSKSSTTVVREVARATTILFRSLLLRPSGNRLHSAKDHDHRCRNAAAIGGTCVLVFWGNSESNVDGFSNASRCAGTSTFALPSLAALIGFMLCDCRGALTEGSKSTIRPTPSHTPAPQGREWGGNQTALRSRAESFYSRLYYLQCRRV